MKLLIRTKTKKTYYVALPNYFDIDAIPKVLEEATWAMPMDEEVVEHQMHGDQLTNEEKKQLDIYGEIKYPLIQIEIELPGAE